MKTEQTSSFVIRFTQKIFNDDQGEAQLQWRGKISHVQGGDQESFSDFEEAIQFMQNKLSDLTKENIKDKTTKEKEGLLTKSLDIWKKVARNTPKIVMEAIKDPKAQVTQIQEQISHVGDEISERFELDDWKVVTKNDFKQMTDIVQQLSKDVKDLTKKVNKLSKK